MKTIEKRTREPLFHVVKRDSLPVWKGMLIRVIAVVAAILLCALLSVIMLENVDPIKFVTTLFDGAIGSQRRLWKLAKDTAVLLCISLAVTPAFRMKFWNIGAEGQTLVGALASVAVAYYLGGKMPEPLLLVLMLVASVAAGAAWGGLPALCKAKWNTNETLFTLMMNYVATGAFKIASKPQMDDFGDHDCCLAQGPEGLATAVNSAFSAKDKLFVNFYEDAEIDFSVQNCNVSMTISGNYPSQNSVKIKFAADAKAYFTLALRIPAWSENTVVKLNGKTFTPEKGKYFEFAEKWSSESEIEIIFDMKLQKITAPGNADFHAFKYGPFVLAHDSRDAEVLRRKSLFMTETDGINFCDYATSGNDFSPENTLQVWFE